MTSLYIEGVLVELPPGFKFAITFKKMDLADITKREITFTNSVKLPWTPTTLALFEFALNEKSGTNKPYRKLSAKIVTEGIEVIPNGLCWIASLDATGVTVSIYENLLSLFDAMVGRGVQDLYYLTPSAWDAAGIDAARLATTGVKTLIISWGKAGVIYQFNYFLPSFFYDEMTKKILTQTGLTLSGNILTDARFTDLLIPYFKDTWAYPAGVQEALNQSAKRASSALVLAPLLDFTVLGGTGALPVLTLDTYDIPASAPANTWDLPNGRWVVPNLGNPDGVDFAIVTLGIVWDFDIQFYGAAFGDFRGNVIRIRDGVSSIVEVMFPFESNPGGPIGPYNVTTPSGTGPLTIRNGDIFYIEVGNSATDPITDRVDVTINTMTLSITSVALNRTLVNWNFLLGDVLQIDIIKDFTARFGIIYKQTGNTLFLKTLEEILADTAGALDWTDKRIDTKEGDGIIFRGFNYAQYNIFDHSDSIEDQTVGRGAISIVNAILDEVKSLFVSAFENATSSTIDGGIKAVIPVYDASSTSIDTMAEAPGLHIVTQRARHAGEGNITFNGVARNDYKVGYFQDATKTKDTSFRYFVSQFYGRLQRSLQSAKTITRSYNLTTSDVAGFDPHKMIYDNGSYYLVVKINNFIPGRPTKVELFKV